MRIVFHSLNAYDMLVGREDGVVGGAQLQQILVGRELATRGHEVVFVEDDTPHKNERTIDGVQIVLKPQREGNIAYRTTRSMLDVVRMLRDVNPDVCYRRVLHSDLLPLSVYCRLSDTRFVYGFAHDSEVTDNPVALDRPVFDNPLYKHILRYALSQADQLIAQNNFQLEHARERFGDQITRIPNGYPDGEGDARNVLTDVGAPMVLWVGTLRSWKQPEIVLEVADAVPEAEFIIVGGPASDEPEVHREIKQGVATRSNVRYEGFVPYERVDDYFAAADIFLNTSAEEGFPNTFLQAWAHATTVASLSVDPDSILAGSGVGVFAEGSEEALIECIQNIIGDDEQRQTLGDTAYRYYQENYSITHIADRYEHVFTAE
jgi:glycosyltransferase involved in cell wall biosynthesis